MVTIRRQNLDVLHLRERERRWKLHLTFEPLNFLCIAWVGQLRRKETTGYLLVHMEMDSTPQEKTEYELARDRRVAEVQKRMAPVVAALQEW